MKIKELMTKQVVTLSGSASICEAVKLLNKEKIGCLVVLCDGKIEGILTERDLLHRVLEKGKNPKQTKVSDIMTREVIVGQPSMEVYEASSIMIKYKIKKLPIVDKNQSLIGIVTVTDVARATIVDKETIELVEALANMHMLER